MATLRTVGGSVMLAIPKPILDGLDLAPNTQVSISVYEGRLIIEPHPKPRYTMAELLARCDISAPPTDEDTAWMDDAPLGREIL